MSESNTHEKLSNIELYNHQVELLKTFLEHGAINKAQFDKSYGDLTEKMFPDTHKPPTA